MEDGSVSRTEMCGGGKCVEDESVEDKVWRMEICGGWKCVEDNITYMYVNLKKQCQILLAS